MKRPVLLIVGVVAGAVLVAGAGASAHEAITLATQAGAQSGALSDEASGAREQESPEATETPETEPTEQPEAQPSENAQDEDNDEQGEDNDEQGDDD